MLSLSPNDVVLELVDAIPLSSRGKTIHVDQRVSIGGLDKCVVPVGPHDCWDIAVCGPGAGRGELP